MGGICGRLRPVLLRELQVVRSRHLSYTGNRRGGDSGWRCGRGRGIEGREQRLHIRVFFHRWLGLLRCGARLACHGRGALCGLQIWLESRRARGGGSRGCPPSEHLSTRGESSNLAVELLGLLRGWTGGLAAAGARTTGASESGLCTFSLLLSLLLQSRLFLVRLFHGLKAVRGILGKVLGLFHVRHGLIELPNLRSFVLPHLRDEFGYIGLGASGLTGRLRVLEDFHLCGAVEDPSIGRTRGPSVRRGTAHADEVDPRVGEQVRTASGTGGAALEVGLDDVDVIERGRGCGESGDGGLGGPRLRGRGAVGGSGLCRRWRRV